MRQSREECSEVESDTVGGALWSISCRVGKAQSCTKTWFE